MSIIYSKENNSEHSSESSIRVLTNLMTKFNTKLSRNRNNFSGANSQKYTKEETPSKTNKTEAKFNKKECSVSSKLSNLTQILNDGINDNSIEVEEDKNFVHTMIRVNKLNRDIKQKTTFSVSSSKSKSSKERTKEKISCCLFFK